MKLKSQLKIVIGILSMILLISSSSRSLAQTSSSNSVEISQSPDGKIRLKVSKEIDGEIKNFEKEYSSREEMMNDPAYKEFYGEDPDFSWYGNGGQSFSFGFGHTEDIMMDFRKHFDMQFGNDHFKMFFDDFDQSFAFPFDNDQQLKDQLKQRYNFDYDNQFPEDLEDELAEIESRLKELSEQFDDFDFNLNISPKSGPHSNAIFLKRKKLTIKDIEREEKSQNKYGTLELNDVSYYPNPNDGRFTLRFSMPGQAPLKVAVYDLAGQEVYVEAYDSFGGLFKQELDLSNEEPGVYILEISSGKRKLNKKLILE